MTWRQYLAWQYWFREEFNRPDRADHYRAAIACEVRRVLSQHPERVKPEDFLLRFSFAAPRKDSPVPSVDNAARAAVAKARWFAATGFKSDSLKP